MTLFIDEIHKFYSNPQNVKAFEEWRKKNMKTRTQQLKKAHKLMGWVYGDILSQLVYHFKERK